MSSAAIPNIDSGVMSLSASWYPWNLNPSRLWIADGLVLYPLSTAPSCARFPVADGLQFANAARMWSSTRFGSSAKLPISACRFRIVSSAGTTVDWFSSVTSFEYLQVKGSYEVEGGIERGGLESQRPRSRRVVDRHAA